MGSAKTVFVQEWRSGKFLSKDGAWIVSLSKAAVFGTTAEAYSFCEKNFVHEADIVLRMGDPEYDVKIPVE